MTSSLKDVAAEAHVSTATVARVLSNSTRVSPELTARVRDAIARLNYLPNSVARSLSEGRTHRLGLLVSDISNPFVAQVTKGFEDAAASAGDLVLIGSSDFNVARESELLDSFATRTVDGVALLSARGLTDSMHRLLNSGIPLVFIDRRPDESLRVPLVRSDNFSGAQDAVNYLISLGHRDLGMISGPTDLPTAAQRTAGFLRACEAAGLTVRAECLRTGFLGTQGGEQAMEEILSLPTPPTALFSFNNLLAVGALTVARARGVSIPGDLSFATFDDMDLFALVDPPITAVAQPARHIGLYAGRSLISMINGDHGIPQEVILPTVFRKRSSCAPPTPRVDHRGESTSLTS